MVVLSNECMAELPESATKVVPNILQKSGEGFQNRLQLVDAASDVATMTTFKFCSNGLVVQICRPMSFAIIN